MIRKLELRSYSSRRMIGKALRITKVIPIHKLLKKLTRQREETSVNNLKHKI